jgi:DNA-binding Xre family transcriptional regulator
MIIFQLREALEKRDMSVYRLAKLTGIAQMNLAALYHNKSVQVRRDTLAKICSALGITDMNELLKIVPDEKP